MSRANNGTRRDHTRSHAREGKGVVDARIEQNIGQKSPRPNRTNFTRLTGWALLSSPFQSTVLPAMKGSALFAR